MFFRSRPWSGGVSRLGGQVKNVENMILVLPSLTPASFVVAGSVESNSHFLSLVKDALLGGDDTERAHSNVDVLMPLSLDPREL